MGSPCYIFDLDGTLCDISHRLHFIRDPLDTPHGFIAPPPGEPREEWKADWPAFYRACPNDAPILHMIRLAETLWVSGVPLIFVSGREDTVRVETIMWLKRHHLAGALLMRKAGDHRADAIIKGELLDEILAMGYQPLMAFEDRASVVEMWRARGIPCAQVAEGNF